ncbi:transcriptional regulator RcsA [Pluralibacter gergoviae]
MSMIIMDLCSFTRLGLTGYLMSRGVKGRDIRYVERASGLQAACRLKTPAVVFINEDCFIHHAQHSQQIRQTILDSRDTLFIIFMAITNVHYDACLLVRKNLLVSSKSIKPESLDALLAGHLKKSGLPRAGLNIPTLTLSRTESDMLRMWMNGKNTLQISDLLNIKAKTVSSHKGNIKRKIQTHNKQVIYHVFRLADNVTSGICVNMR